VKELD
jgi:hypothetical protein